MEFTWSPDLGARRLREPDVKVTKFGGYEARTPTSIHFNLRKWSCTFTRNLPEINEIDAFLEQASGVSSFIWTDPSGYKGTFVCRKWELSQQNKGLFSIVGEFEEVFDVK